MPDQPKVCGALLVARGESSLQPGPGLSVCGKCAQSCSTNKVQGAHFLLPTKDRNGVAGNTRDCVDWKARLVEDWFSLPGKSLDTRCITSCSLPSSCIPGTSPFPLGVWELWSG